MSLAQKVISLLLLLSTVFPAKAQWKLVWSDEFNTDGRTFYPGDDPFWEAEDLHYWGTNNMEWYSPGMSVRSNKRHLFNRFSVVDAITTKDGYLSIQLDKKPSHDLKYEGGLLTSWNKFCFTGGLIEGGLNLSF